MHARTGYATWIALAAALACALALALPQAGYANVRKSDTVYGSTVEQRELASSQCPDVSAERAIVLGSDGTVYFERNADDECHIASITKVMTAIVACENAPLDATVTVSANAAGVGESTASLRKGDTMTLGEALKALLWPSGNDAAIAIAESVGGSLLQSEGRDPSDAAACLDRFVDAMNEQASKIGMTGTVFSNPHGLDTDAFGNEQMHSSARDVATMLAYAMNVDAIRSITSVDGGTCTVNRDGGEAKLELMSTDELLGAVDGAQGVKTGFTDSAGYCFAGSCERDGERIIAVSLGCAAASQRFTDCKNLWEWTFAHRISYPLAHASTNQNGKPVVAYVSCTAWPDSSVAATLANPDEAITVFDLGGNVSEQASFKEPEGGVKQGDDLGELTFFQRNRVVATATLVAAEDKPAPNPLEGIGIWWQRLFGGAAPGESYLANDTPLIYDKAA